MSRIVEVPADWQGKVVFRREDGPTGEVPNTTPREALEIIGCVVEREGRAYTWHRCPAHDLIIIWMAYDVEEGALIPKGEWDD